MEEARLELLWEGWSEEEGTAGGDESRPRRVKAKKLPGKEEVRISEKGQERESMSWPQAACSFSPAPKLVSGHEGSKWKDRKLRRTKCSWPSF